MSATPIRSTPEFPMATQFVYSGSNAIAQYLACGLAANEGLIVIASFEHLEMIKNQLKADHQVDVDSYLKKEQLLPLNASRALSKVMDGDIFRPELFLDVIEPILKRLLMRFPKVRVYREMSNILWGRHNIKAALELDNLWVELAEKYKVSCLWANPLSFGVNQKYLCEIQSTSVHSYFDSQKIRALEIKLNKAQHELKNTKSNLESSNQDQTQFLSALSFEIRSPLTSILGFSELLEDPNLSEQERASYLQKVIDNSRLLAKVADEMLGISKVESTQEVQKVRFSLRAMLQEIAVEMKTEAWKKGISFHSHWVGDVPEELESDPKLLRQVLSHLIRNSIQATASGSVDLTVTSKTLITDGSELIFYIRDTGSGISTQHMSQLFSPSSSATGANAVNPQIGLFFTRIQARSLGGDVQLIGTNPGSGSLFKFFLNLPSETISLPGSETDSQNIAHS